MPIYGQVVVGPPGAGKTTYCNGMQQYLRLVGRPDTLVVNLDPANESTGGTAATSASPPKPLASGQKARMAERAAKKLPLRPTPPEQCTSTGRSGVAFWCASTCLSRSRTSSVSLVTP